MSESFDPKNDQSNVERLDYCPCCEGNFLDYQIGKPIERYGDEWMISLACNACDYKDDNVPASDEGLTMFNMQRSETSRDMSTEMYQIRNMSVSTLMNELEKSGILPPLEPRA